MVFSFCIHSYSCIMAYWRPKFRVETSCHVIKLFAKCALVVIENTDILQNHIAYWCSSTNNITWLSAHFHENPPSQSPLQYGSRTNSPPGYIMQPVAIFVNYEHTIKITQWFRWLVTLFVVIFPHVVHKQVHNNGYGSLP